MSDTPRSTEELAEALEARIEWHDACNCPKLAALMREAAARLREQERALQANIDRIVAALGKP